MASNNDPITVPLTSASIEIRFPGDARIDSLRGLFQQAIRNEFPLLFLPRLEAGDFPSLLDYRFSNEARTRSLDVALHSFVYTSEVYPGWHSFLKEFLGYWHLLDTELTISDYTRIAIRYENRFPREWKLFLDSEHLPSYMAALKDDSSFYRSLISLPKGSHELLVSVYKPQGEEALQVDYDAFVTQPSTADQLQEILAMLHTTVEAEFLNSIDSTIAHALDLE